MTDFDYAAWVARAQAYTDGLPALADAESASAEEARHRVHVFTQHCGQASKSGVECLGPPRQFLPGRLRLE